MTACENAATENMVQKPLFPPASVLTAATLSLLCLPLHAKRFLTSGAAPVPLSEKPPERSAASEPFLQPAGARQPAPGCGWGPSRLRVYPAGACSHSSSQEPLAG